MVLYPYKDEGGIILKKEWQKPELTNLSVKMTEFNWDFSKFNDYYSIGKYSIPLPGGKDNPDINSES